MPKPGSSRRGKSVCGTRSTVRELEKNCDDEDDSMSTGDEEASDAGNEVVFEVNSDDEYDSEESCEEDEAQYDMSTKDGTQWSRTPLPSSKTRKRNILRQNGGAAKSTNLCTAKEIFKTIMSSEMISTILNETNKKARQVLSCRENRAVHIDFTTEELEAFFGLLLFAGVHRSNKENIAELWMPGHLPLFRATMSRSRFYNMLRFIRIDDGTTRSERSKTDKAAAVRTVWEFEKRIRSV